MIDKTGFYDKFIEKIPNFPREGILFYDITSTILNPEVYSNLIEDMYEFYCSKKIEMIAVVESRGYLIGAPLALKMKLPLVLVRKEGKLPREVLKGEYELEYGSAKIEIHKDDIIDGANVLLIDDLLATGGTLKSASTLIEQAGGKVSNIFCFIELLGINGREVLSDYDLNSLVKYN